MGFNPKSFMLVFLALISALLFGAGIFYAGSTVPWGWFLFLGLLTVLMMLGLTDQKFLNKFFPD